MNTRRVNQSADRLVYFINTFNHQKMAQANEQGLVENPLMISWLDGQEPTGPAKSEGVLPEAALKGDLNEV